MSTIEDPFDNNNTVHNDDNINNNNNNNNKEGVPVKVKYDIVDTTDKLDTIDINSSTNNKNSKNIFPSDLNDRKEGNNNNNSNNNTKSGIYEVTVADPEKKGEGLMAYVSYKVNTKMEYAPGKFRQSSVVRRYRDFLWLRNELLSENSGWLVPPLPEKALIGRFSPMFVDSRRRGLEQFLNRLARHKELAKSEVLQLFLHGGQDFEDAKAGKVSVDDNNNNNNNNKKKKSGWMDYFNDLQQTVSQAVGATKEREKSKDDITCDNIDVWAELLGQKVDGVFNNVSTLTKRTKEIANAWFDLGFSCTLLGQFQTEGEEQALGNAFANLGNCADRLSVLISQQVDTQLVGFEEPIHDFLLQVNAVREMIKCRNNVLGKYQSKLAQLESLRARLAKYQQQHNAKALEVEKNVEEQQQVVDESLRDLQTVTERVFSEVARFRSEMRTTFKNIMLDFARMQIEQAKKIQAAWEAVIPEIERLQLD